MKHSLRRLAQLMGDALAGKLGVMMMTLSYAMVAVVLLAYVSTQVYTNSLMEGISQRRMERRQLEERIGLLSGDYAELSSRTRISRYCEKQLAMVEADVEQVVRVSVRGDDDVFAGLQRFAARPVDLPAVLGSQLSELTEVMGR